MTEEQQILSDDNFVDENFPEQIYDDVEFVYPPFADYFMGFNPECPEDFSFDMP